MKISPARISAFEVLLRVETERSHSSALLADREQALGPLDRGLCHEIVLGTLRNLILLDDAIGKISGRKPEKFDSEVLVSLRMGLYQLRFLDKVPDYAVVSDSVDLVVRAGKRSARGFVNAVLRKAVRSGFEKDEMTGAEGLSVRYSHPLWLVEKWIGVFGLEETEALLKFNNSNSPSAFRFTRRFDLLDEDQRVTIRQKIAEDPSIAASEVVEGAYIAHGRSDFLDGISKQNLIYFQDEGSQLVAKAAVIREAGSFLDVCAAPGSKVTYAARKFDRSKEMIVACELHSGRASLLKRICAEQQTGFVSVVQADAEKGLPFRPDVFDTVLVDAPCTGTGTIAQNPELRYYLKPSDPGELRGKQLRILANASNAVKPGGRLIYSTCSLEVEENESVADEFRESHTNFQTEIALVPDRFKGSDGYAKTLPQRDGISGFFIAFFRRLS